MPFLSVVINVDTRPERSNNEKMFAGVVDREFIIDGLINKQILFKDFDAEYIVFVDEHEPLDEQALNALHHLADVVVIRQHNKRFEENDNFPAFNDLNYINALSLCRGSYVFHFDGDCAAFAPNKEAIEEMINQLEQYDYISYPSMFSPDPDRNDNYNYWWVSTRFFCCKRKTLDFTEILKCQLDYDYMFSEYPASVRNHWLEHVLGVQAKFKGSGVFYPPINYDKMAMFVWNNYRKGLLKELNEFSYETIKAFVSHHGGIHYPNNFTLR